MEAEKPKIAQFFSSKGLTPEEMGLPGEWEIEQDIYNLLHKTNGEKINTWKNKEAIKEEK